MQRLQAGASGSHALAQTRDLDLGAAFHHYLEPGCLCAPGSQLVPYPQLHPDHLDALLLLERNGFVDHSPSSGRPPKDVDHLERHRDVGKRSIDAFPQDLLAGLARIDRQHPITLPLEELHHPVARPFRLWTGTDQRDGGDGLENAEKIIVAIAVVSHGPRYGDRKSVV